MKRRDLLKALPVLLLPLLPEHKAAASGETHTPDEYQGQVVMKHFDANDIPPMTMTAYLDGVDVTDRATSIYAPSLPGFEAKGWCELLVLRDGHPFSLEIGGEPVTEIKEGMVRWEMNFLG